MQSARAVGALPYTTLAPTPAAPLLVDGQNRLDPAAVIQAGLTYIGRGRGTHAAEVAAPHEVERSTVYGLRFAVCGMSWV